MPIKPRSCKNKGARFQKEIKELIHEHFPEIERDSLKVAEIIEDCEEMNHSLGKFCMFDLVLDFVNGIGAYRLSKKYNVDKATIYNRFKKIRNYELLKEIYTCSVGKLREESKGFKVKNCVRCDEEFKPTGGKQIYCSQSCLKSNWREKNRDSFNKKRKSRAKVNITKTEKQLWLDKFVEKLKPMHPRSYEKKAYKIITKVQNAKASLVTRSRKKDVKCEITIDELRNMYYDAYGTKCKYTDRLLDVNNMVFDHIIPISKGGESTVENLQIISKFANNVKGSLDEDSFLKLLHWLNNIDDENLKKDVLIRLANGIH